MDLLRRPVAVAAVLVVASCVASAVHGEVISAPLLTAELLLEKPSGAPGESFDVALRLRMKDVDGRGANEIGAALFGTGSCRAQGSGRRAFVEFTAAVFQHRDVRFHELLNLGRIHASEVIGPLAAENEEE